MSLPTNPVDKHLPKGANFLAVVIGFAIAILVVLLAAWILIGHRGKKVLPVGTKTTPSQTMLRSPRELQRVVLTAPLAPERDA